MYKINSSASLSLHLTYIVGWKSFSAGISRIMKHESDGELSRNRVCVLFPEFSHTASAADVSGRTSPSIPTRSRLIMNPPDGKWSYRAKPGAAEAAQYSSCGEISFHRYWRILVSKWAELALVGLSDSVFGSGFFVVLGLGKRGWLAVDLQKGGRGA